VHGNSEFKGVIIDWGGVLTTPILTTVRAWIQADGIDWASYAAVMRPWIAQAYDRNGGPDPAHAPDRDGAPDPVHAPDRDGALNPVHAFDRDGGPDLVHALEREGGPNPVHALERGECSGADFERLLAARLVRMDGGAVVAEGLLRRMFAASVPVPGMYDTIRALRSAGFSTSLLSNSWGCDEYPRADFPSLFDTVVLSGEVGMRKPEEQIFLHAAETLGLAPQDCVFIDDIEANVAAAVACGMTGVHHTETATTAAALQDLLGVPLAWSGPGALGI
jgi:putative hydrolase of the HAD superfamily